LTKLRETEAGSQQHETNQLSEGEGLKKPNKFSYRSEIPEKNIEAENRYSSPFRRVDAACLANQCRELVPDMLTTTSTSAPPIVPSPEPTLVPRPRSICKQTGRRKIGNANLQCLADSADMAAFLF
jgi:hypothetical protein